MANDLSGRQWRLDTALAFGQPGAVIYKSNVKIKDAVCAGATAAGTAILKDGVGRIIGEATIGTSLASERMGEIGWANGICMDTLPTGAILTVYVQ
jgi:hypothetical protein